MCSLIHICIRRQQFKDYSILIGSEVPDTKFGKNPLKDVDPRVFTRMLQKDGRTVALLYPFATSLAREY
jgi:hypothetical protein